MRIRHRSLAALPVERCTVDSTAAKQTVQDRHPDRAHTQRLSQRLSQRQLPLFVLTSVYPLRRLCCPFAQNDRVAAARQITNGINWKKILPKLFSLRIAFAYSSLTLVF